MFKKNHFNLFIRGPEGFIWLLCPFNHENYKLVIQFPHSKLRKPTFNEVLGKAAKLRFFPVKQNENVYEEST